jgi:hypothetical protein
MRDESGPKAAVSMAPLAGAPQPAEIAGVLRRVLYGEGSHFSCRMYRASTGESPDDRDDRRRGARPRDSIRNRAVPFAKCRYATA